MKITNVRACQPLTPESPRDWRTDLGQILVAIDTDQNLTGYGVGGGGFAAIHIVQTVLRDMLLGKDTSDIPGLWNQMFRNTLAYGQKGVVLMAISGVDLALWDLKGRAEQVPVCDLLGGLKTPRIPSYITVWNREELNREFDNAHQAFKLHLSSDGLSDVDSYCDRIEQEVADARRLIGSQAELMADAWMRWTPQLTMQVIDRIAPHQLSWLEEPLPVDDYTAYEQLAATSAIPIAGGEHEYTAAAFTTIAQRRAHHVLQPDVCWCGGLTQLLEIYDIGRRYDLRVCPHRGSELWSLHALAAIDPAPLAESGRPWMTWVKGQPPMVEGWIEPPTAPGFGIEIDESRLQVMPAPTSNWLGS